MTRLTDKLRSWSAVGSLTLLCLVIALSPLPFGSVAARFSAIWVAVLGVSTVLASLRPLRSHQVRLLAALSAFCCCWAAVSLMQMSSWAHLQALDSPIWMQTGNLLGEQLQAVPAELKRQPLLSQGPAMVAVLALSTAFVLSDDERFAKWIMMTFAWSGLFYAVFGIVSYLIDPSKVLGFNKDAYLSELTATFYNRNTAAIYFGCCAVVWLVSLVKNIKARPSRRSVGRSWLPVERRLLVSGLALALCMVAMFMTRSRAGSLASIVGMLIVLMVLYRRSFKSRSSMVVAGIGMILAAGLLIQFLGGGVTERLSIDGASDVGRWHTYLSTMELIKSAPWLGTGLGTYAWVYPAYRSSAISTWGVWDRAHNTLLELIAEVGVPLAVLLVVGWLVMLAVLIRGVLIRERGVGRPTAALGVLTAATLHSMVDFPLQIPAFSVVVFSLTGVGLARALSARPTH